MKIFALPYAIGNISMYYELKTTIDSKIQLIPLELPGHGYRANEIALETIEDMANDIFIQIIGQIGNEEYGLLGYSMGSYICYELYYKLQKAGYVLPSYLFLSACPPPGIKRSKYRAAEAGVEELKQLLYRFGGTSKSVIENNELIELILPCAIGDFTALDCYEPLKTREKIKSEGIIIYSLEECRNIEEWEDCFLTPCVYEKVYAGHFFINESADVLKVIIENHIRL